MVKPLNVINGEKLMDMAYQPIRYTVQNILSQGLTILAGAPKTGKSFLALWLCLCVAKGEKLWDFETTQGTVLYLCLEDNNARLQNRLYAIADDAPANLFFCSESELLGKGLEEQIALFMEGHPDTVLVVIDTFQCIRPQGADYSYVNIIPLGSHQFPASEPPGNGIFHLQSHHNILWQHTYLISL